LNEKFTPINIKELFPNIDTDKFKEMMSKPQEPKPTKIKTMKF